MLRIFRTKVEAEPPAHFTLRQQRDRAADELVGLCRGVLADGAVSSQEARFLLDWCERNAHLGSEYPFNYLYRALHGALTDGVLDPEEEADLLGTLLALIGGEAHIQARDQVIASLSTTLPLCNPAPPIEFSGSAFVVTGTFAYGPRASVAEVIRARGGEVKPTVTKKVDYLVIGEIGSQAWKHSSWGRKIEAAVALRDQGARLRIVSEPHWANHLT